MSHNRVWPLMFCAAWPMWAGAAPDAGAVLRQIEPDRAPVLPATSQSQGSWTEPAPPLDGESTTPVKGFRFVGNHQLTDRQLKRALRGFEDRPLSLSQMKQAAQVVTQRYRKAGWMVRAFLPRQEIEGGIVTIRVVEVAFAGVKLPAEKPKRIAPQKLLNIVQAAQPQGEALNVTEIDRALLLMDDLPGVSVAGNYVAGDADDQTALALLLSDEPVANGSVTVDNQGARSTGAERVMLNVSLNSPTQQGDQVTATLLKTQSGDDRQSQYVRLAYTLPAGSQGWRVGTQASHMDYRSKTTDQSGEGDSQTWGLTANYPLLRSLDRNLYAALAYDHKRFASQSGASPEANRHRVDVLNTSLSGNWRDEWGQGAVTSASLTYALGRVHDVVDATQGAYRKWSLTLNRQQQLGGGWSLLASAQMQRTKKSLDSSEKLYLGGANSVRAYPGSEAGGDQGHSVSLELRQKLGTQWSWLSFVDQGEVKPASGSTNLPANLRGAGLGLAWQSAKGSEAKLTLARRVGHNPNPMADGSDSDGTLKLNRLWLSLSSPF